MPTLDVGEGDAGLVTGLDVFGAELGRKRPDLGVRECHHFVLTEIVMPPLPSMAPGIVFPALKVAISPWRSSFGGCGFQ